jgi:hypothetical protein
MAKAIKHPVKVKRIADRRYRGHFTSESGRCIGVDLIAPAEYGVFVDGVVPAQKIPPLVSFLNEGHLSDGHKVTVKVRRFGEAV